MGALSGSPEMDPLTEKDDLQEALLNEVAFDAVRGRVGLLFDLAARCSYEWRIQGCSSWVA